MNKFLPPQTRIRNSELFEGIIYDIGIGNTFVGNYGYWSPGETFQQKLNLLLYQTMGKYFKIQPKMNCFELFLTVK